MFGELEDQPSEGRRVEGVEVGGHRIVGLELAVGRRECRPAAEVLVDDDEAYRDQVLAEPAFREVRACAVALQVAFGPRELDLVNPLGLH